MKQEEQAIEATPTTANTCHYLIIRFLISWAIAIASGLKCILNYSGSLFTKQARAWK